MAASKIDTDVVFNMSAVKAAQHQKILQGWLSGASDQYPGQTRNETEVEQEEKGIFILDSEIAGLGVPPQSRTDDDYRGSDPFTRAEDSSTAFLRQQMIGKQGKGRKVPPPIRSAINLPGVELGFQPSKLKGVNAALSSATQNDQGTRKSSNLDIDIDDEDDIGRSGLGKRKRGLKSASNEPQIAAPAASTIDFVEDSSQTYVGHHPPAHADVDEGESSRHDSVSEVNSTSARGAKKTKSSSKSKARSYLDEVLAAKEAKKQRKKKKNEAG